MGEQRDVERNDVIVLADGRRARVVEIHQYVTDAGLLVGGLLVCVVTIFLLDTQLEGRFIEGAANHERYTAQDNDSPIGLRLPLPSLPWQRPERRPVYEPLDPMAERGPLPPAPEDPAGLHPPLRIDVSQPGEGARERIHEQTPGDPDRVPGPGHQVPAR